MRLTWIGGIGLALALPAASPVLAGEPAVQGTADPAKAAAKAAGLHLAHALYTEQAQVDIAVRMVDTQVGPAFRSNEDFKILEAEYPGFIDALLKDFKVAIARYTREILPDHYDRMASIFAEHLSAEEIDDLAGFYRTPTGQKLLRGVSENLSAQNVLAEAVADPDKPTSLSAISADHRATTAAAAKLIDKSDEAALIALAQKPYFARAQAVIPKMRKLNQDFMNEPAPGFEKEIQRIVESTLKRFEAAKKK